MPLPQATVGVLTRGWEALVGVGIRLGAAIRRPPVEYLEVTGDSMIPTLHAGDWILARKGAQARPGDVVVAVGPGDRPDLLKRVARVDAGGYWLVGDNPGRSTDSRHFGPVPTVRAKVVWRVRPWGRIPAAPGSVPGPSQVTSE